MDDIDSLLEQLQPVNGYRLQPEVLPAMPEPEPPPLDVRKHIQQHEMISAEILASWRSDRQEAQTAVNFLKDLIDDARSNGQNPSSAMLEMYVKAMEVKGNTNAIAVRLLDATAKLIAANRAGTQINNNSLTVTGNSKDLVEVLKNGGPVPGDP